MYTSVLNTQRGYQVASSRNVLGDRHLNLFTICSSNTTIFTPVSQHVTFACKSPVKSHRLYAFIRTGPNAVSTKSIKLYKRTLEWQDGVYPGVEEYTLRWSCELWLSKQPRRALCKWGWKCTSSVSHSSSMEFYSSCALPTIHTGHGRTVSVTSLLCTHPYDRHHLLLLSSLAPSWSMEHFA